METLRRLLARIGRIGLRGEIISAAVLFGLGLILIVIGDAFGWLLMVGSAVAAVLSFRALKDRGD